MKVVKSLLLKPNVFGGKQKAGPKAGPATICPEGGLGIEGAGFGIYPDTEERDPDAGTLL
jgi:hypothetical protein